MTAVRFLAGVVMIKKPWTYLENVDFVKVSSCPPPHGGWDVGAGRRNVRGGF